MRQNHVAKRLLATPSPSSSSESSQPTATSHLHGGLRVPCSRDPAAADGARVARESSADRATSSIRDNVSYLVSLGIVFLALGIVHGIARTPIARISGANLASLTALASLRYLYHLVGFMIFGLAMLFFAGGTPRTPPESTRTASPQRSSPAVSSRTC